MSLAPEAFAAELRALNETRWAELDRKMAQLLSTWDAMMAKAVNGLDDPTDRSDVLAWCREQIDVPPKAPFPAGQVTVEAIKEWYINEDAREMIYVDAITRAWAHKFFTTLDSDLN